MHRIIFAAVLFFFSFPGVAFSQDCTTSVVVNVFDDHLHVDVQTLKAEDFEAVINKKAFAIAGARQNYDSRLLVLLETDGSANDDHVSSEIETITAAARQIPEGKPVAFGIYADRAIFTPGFFAEPAARTAAINAVIEQQNSLGKRVALFDALHQALHLFGEPRPGDTILLLGSPYDDKSKLSPGTIEKEFLAAGTRFMPMLRDPMSRVGRGDLLLSNHEREKAFFLDFPERSGGAHSEFDPRFLEFTWRGYMLDVRMPESLRKPHEWTLKLSTGIRESFRHTKIFYPELLPPCRVEAQNPTPK